MKVRLGVHSWLLASIAHQRLSSEALRCIVRFDLICIEGPKELTFFHHSMCSGASGQSETKVQKALA